MLKKNNQEIIPPLLTEELESHLSRLAPIYTNKTNGIVVYCFIDNGLTELLSEVGRLREISYRHIGLGTGKSFDIDCYDKVFPQYRQIIVYDLLQKKIICGCRCYAPIFFPSKYHRSTKSIATSNLFVMSDEFIENYLPYTLDVGRVFVIPELHAQFLDSVVTNIRSPLEYIWKGLGYLIAHHDIRYFLGRVIINNRSGTRVRDLIYKYLETHFADYRLMYSKQAKETKSIKHPFIKEHSFLDDLHLLKEMAKKEGKMISPLIQAYVKLSPTMKFYGSAFDSDLGKVEEMAIMITIKDIFKNKFDKFKYKSTREE